MLRWQTIVTRGPALPIKRPLPFQDAATSK